MNFLNVLLLAVALSMDAFAVSTCKGLACGKLKKRYYLCVGLWFGGFQALMPTVGYFAAGLFADYITAFDHWVAFGLLVLIGANMIREAFSKESEELSADFSFKTMLLMAIATSIDALAVGVSMAFDETVDIAVAAPIIGIITFALSALGLKFGNIFGLKYKKKAELVGGIILVLMGIRILLEGLGVIAF